MLYADLHPAEAGIGRSRGARVTADTQLSQLHRSIARP